jgi:hypothetical protein
MKFLQNSVKFHEIWQEFVTEYDSSTYQFLFFCDFFQFCDVVCGDCPQKDSALVLTSFVKTVKTVKNWQKNSPPALQLETVSKSDGIASKFGEICQEFVTEHSF